MLSHWPRDIDGVHQRTWDVSDTLGTMVKLPLLLGIKFRPFLFAFIYCLVHSILAQHNGYSYQPWHSRWSSPSRMGRERMDWRWEKMTYLRRSISIYRGSSLESSSDAISVKKPKFDSCLLQFGEIFEISFVHKSQIFDNFHEALPPIVRVLFHLHMIYKAPNVRVMSSIALSLSGVTRSRRMTLFVPHIARQSIESKVFWIPKRCGRGRSKERSDQRLKPKVLCQISTHLAQIWNQGFISLNTFLWACWFCWHHDGEVFGFYAFANRSMLKSEELQWHPAGKMEKGTSFKIAWPGIYIIHPETSAR